MSAGWTLRVVSNKFPALRVEGDLNRQGEGLYDKMNGVGAHEVIIETPDHKLSLADLSEKQVADVLWAFRERMLDLRRDIRLRYILVFKNHGEAAGASLEHHPFAVDRTAGRPQTRHRGESRAPNAITTSRNAASYCDIVRNELDTGVRVVLETAEFLAIAPYAPRFPFETWILPRTHASHYEDIDAPSAQKLAWVLRTTLRKLDKVLEHPPYNLVLHTAPVQEGAMPHYHWHIELIPKLTRVAGFEWGSGIYINPTPPEEAAAFMRDAGLS